MDLQQWRREKGPLNQAPPLEVEHLQRLHEILDKGANDIDRIGAGAFLSAIYARARWSDLRYIHHIKYDGYKRNATMDLYTAEHKTSMTGLRREQFLPLVIPSEGCSWRLAGNFHRTMSQPWYRLGKGAIWATPPGAQTGGRLVHEAVEHQ